MVVLPFGPALFCHFERRFGCVGLFSRNIWTCCKLIRSGKLEWRKKTAPRTDESDVFSWFRWGHGHASQRFQCWGLAAFDHTASYLPGGTPSRLLMFSALEGGHPVFLVQNATLPDYRCKELKDCVILCPFLIFAMLFPSYKTRTYWYKQLGWPKGDFTSTKPNYCQSRFDGTVALGDLFSGL